MTKYPVPLEQRHAQTLQNLQNRVKVLESRTMGIDSGTPLMQIPGVVDAAYPNDNSNPKVYVNGSATLTGPYPFLSGYSPTAGDQVTLVPVQSSYLIAGNAGTATYNLFTDVEADQLSVESFLYAPNIILAQSAGVEPSAPGGSLWVDTSNNLWYTTSNGNSYEIHAGP